MADFYDRGLAVDGSFYWLVLTGDLDVDNANYNWCFPRHARIRECEAAPIRDPRAWVYLNGGAALSSGNTVLDATSVIIQMGFLDDASDRVLVSSMCACDIPIESVTNPPTPGDRVWIQLGVGPADRLTVFMGVVDSAALSADGRTHSIVAYDEIRRLLEAPYRNPPEVSDYAQSDIATKYRCDYTETALYASLQLQIVDLLGEAGILTHSLCGIEQGPMRDNGRETIYEELSAMLRSASCRAYLSPSGRFVGTYTDELPLWQIAVRNDLGNRPPVTGGSRHSTMCHLPTTQIRAMYPDRVIAQSESLWGIGPPWTDYPAQYVTDQNVPWVLPMFQFTEHNVIALDMLPSSAVLNMIATHVTQPRDTMSGQDTQGMTGDDLEGLAIFELGDGEPRYSIDDTSLTEYGLRSRTYDLGSLDYEARATIYPTALPGTTTPDVNYGRYTLDGWEWTYAQVRARRFPVDRIRLTSPGILSLSPFEIVLVNLPREGIQGYFQIEGRELRMSSGGFVSSDTLRRMDLPEQIVTLDARD